MPVYNDGMPRQCPPAAASAVECELYIAINGRQPAERDFRSKVEQERCDPRVCQGWGLSVWPDLEAVYHAIEAIPFVSKKKIVRFSVGPDDGCLLITPSRDQPNHHTFWKDIHVDLTGLCEIVITPGNQ